MLGQVAEELALLSATKGSRLTHVGRSASRDSSRCGQLLASRSQLTLVSPAEKVCSSSCWVSWREAHNAAHPARLPCVGAWIKVAKDRRWNPAQAGMSASA